MQNATKSDLLLLFFACLGLTSDLRRLLHGRPRLLRFMVALVPFLLVQDGHGVLLAKLLGLHPFLGLVAGSITLVGGHGTWGGLRGEIRRSKCHSGSDGADNDLGDDRPVARRRHRWACR